MRRQLLRSRRWFRMRASRLRVAGVALVLVAGLSGSAVSAAAETGTQQARGAHRRVLQATGNAGVLGTPTVGATAPARPQLPQSTTVTLPTGDRVQLDAAADGVQQATPIPADTVHGKPRALSTFARFTWRGDQYVIPDQAVPYLHSTLDPRLFDVSYLARAHLGTGGAGLPVRITYASPTADVSLPGVRVARRTGATATATITAAQAGRLGKLLATQGQAARTGRSAAPAGQLPGIRHIALAPPRGAPALPASPTQLPAHPSAAKGLPYYTLTVHFTNRNGKPGRFLGFVQDVGNAGLYASLTTGSGSESLSVPKGTYSLEFSVETPLSSGTGFDTALVVKPQVSVDSDTNITMDARTAVPYRATPGTAVTAKVRSDLIGFVRTSVTGGQTNTLPITFTKVGLGLYSVSPNPEKKYPGWFAAALSATPTAPVTKGGFLFDANMVLSNTVLGGSQGPDPMYIYDFPHPGSIPSSLTYTVPAANLTTVHEQLYRNPSGCSSNGQNLINTQVFLPLGGGQWFGPEFPADHLPAGKRTDYWYSSDPRLDLWQTQVGIGFGTGCTASGYSAVQRIAPGQQITETWNKAPLVPTGLPYRYADYLSSDLLVTGDPRLTLCAACRQDDNGVVNLTAFGDSDPSHYGDNVATVAQTQALRFYRNGTLALSTASQFSPLLPPFGLELPLLPQAASYRLDWTWDREGDSKATVATDWTFHSGPDDPAASLPAGEECAPDATRSCSYLPLLFLRYNLPLTYHSQATAGTSEPINFTVTSQQGAPPPGGVSATVSASFDDGKTWTTPQQATSQGGGRFTTTLSQPALASTDKFVALRVTAKDGSGDSVTQTIIRAYGLTS
jgi:hypothetical protein